MRVTVAVCVALALVVASQAVRTHYDNYKVYQVTPTSEEHAQVLINLQRYEEHVDFWSTFRDLHQPLDIMVAPSFQEMFTFAMKHNNIQYKELIGNVEKVMEMEQLRQEMATKSETGRISFNQYQRYDDIVAYLGLLESLYPGIVTVSTVATTSQNRALKQIKISTGGGGNKPAILVDGGIHAREWIAPATVLYIIQELVENEDNRNMIENVDWYIIPVLNPDGYEFSHTDTRMWRKTRSQGSNCYGVDANRNFDFHWMEVGASPVECSDTYAGPKPMSEPETEAITNALSNHGDQLKMYLTFHSYGQYLLYPWGFDSSLPDDWEELDALAHLVDDAIASVAGTRYTIGSSTNVLYAAAGASDDYVKGIGGVELTYTIELPGGGVNGFDPPPSRIIPIVTETWEGVKVYHQYVEDKFARK